MQNGEFYFIKDKYFIDFPDSLLMKNKEFNNGKLHNRPCFFSFQDLKTKLYWMIPISSQVDKFEKYYNEKMSKYNHCDTIVFGELMGIKKAFLIQNMCPVNLSYIDNQYINSVNGLPVRISKKLENILSKKAKKVLALQRKGVKLILPDVLNIEHRLLSIN